MFAIVSIAKAYSFNWKDIMHEAKGKQVLNETEVALRLKEFSMQLLENINWAYKEINAEDIGKTISQLIKDILLGGDNSLGAKMPPLPG